VGLGGVAVGAASALMVVIATQHHLYLYALVASLVLMISSTGLTRANAAALALDQHGDKAGSAAALLGLIQFTLGAIAAPITGLDQHSAIPPCLTMFAAALLAVLAGIMARRASRRRQHQPPLAVPPPGIGTQVDRRQGAPSAGTQTVEHDIHYPLDSIHV
jgi:MFS transporter, DHA1 family, multidrug resistance protein